MRRLLVMAALVVLASCDRSGVTQPSPIPVGTTAVASASFPLTGGVTDTAGRPLEGAKVEILSGPNTGAFVFTDQDGRFAFSQLFAAVPAAGASKAGYVPATKNVWLYGGVIQGWFRMGSPNPPVDLSGRYTLTFTADPTCQALPQEARSRSYQANIDGSFAVTLTGARFVDAGGYTGNVIYFSAFETFVRLYFSDPPIWEFLNEPASVYIFGEAEGTLSGAVSEFRVTGEFEYCGVTEHGECEEEVACESSNHRLVLTRQ